MKKITLFSVVAIAALSLASCKKDRTCTCTTTSTASGYSSSSSQSITYQKAKKGDARANCLNATWTEDNGGVTVTNTRTCSLK